MNLFYAPPEAFSDGVVELPEEEARHAVRVLRHREGDEIDLVDGVGSRHRVRLTDVDRQRVIGKVVASEELMGEPGYTLTIGLGLIKNASRFETFVEKAVELGVSRIIPLITERTEAVRIRESRLQNIMIAAMKQSGRCRLPRLSEPIRFAEAIHSPNTGVRLLCHERVDSDTTILGAMGNETAGAVAVLVGPEGGFSETEVAAAAAAGWQVVSLGPRRLRAETAGIVAAASVMLRMGGSR